MRGCSCKCKVDRGMTVIIFAREVIAVSLRVCVHFSIFVLAASCCSTVQAADLRKPLVRDSNAPVIGVGDVLVPPGRPRDRDGDAPAVVPSTNPPPPVLVDLSVRKHNYQGVGGHGTPNFVVGIVNNGAPFTAAPGEISISDVIPAGMTVTSIFVPVGWACTPAPILSGQTITCTFGGGLVPNGVFATVSYGGTNVAPIIINCVQVGFSPSSALHDTNPADNTACFTTKLPGTRLARSEETRPRSPDARQTGGPQIVPLMSNQSLWSGTYAGVHAGYSSMTGSTSGSTFTPPPVGPVLGTPYFSPPISIGHGKGTLGLHLGYNWLVSSALVLGLETDLTKLGHKKSGRQIVGAAGYGMDFDASWAGSAKLRVGLPFDRFLVFVSGGLSLAHQKAQFTYRDAATGQNTIIAKHAKTSLGFAVGGGVEYAITHNVIGRAEYVYSDFGKFGFGTGQLSTRLQTIRIGISYKF